MAVLAYFKPFGSRSSPSRAGSRLPLAAKNRIIILLVQFHADGNTDFPPTHWPSPTQSARRPDRLQPMQANNKAVCCRDANANGPSS